MYVRVYCRDPRYDSAIMIGSAYQFPDRANEASYALQAHCTIRETIPKSTVKTQDSSLH